MFMTGVKSISDLKRYQKHIENKLKKIISQDGSIYGAAGYILNAGGKRIRPLITLLACESVGGNFKLALDAAVAIEILHTFTLVHDDIMDNSDTRRGLPTIHKKWDMETAILSGDLLAGLAFKSLIKTNTTKLSEVALVFAQAFIDVCEGQDLDIAYGKKNSVSVEEYYTMIGKKTAAMISAAAEIGGIIGGGTVKEITALRNYGTHIGIAFQIKDDLLDMLGDVHSIGKQAGKDIIEGKKTFLLLTALEKAKGTDLKVLEKISRRRKINQSDIKSVRRVYEKLGIFNSAEKEINSHIRKAKCELRKIPESDALDMLLKVADKILKRNN